MDWQDDPLSKMPAIAVHVPNLYKPPIRFKIKGPGCLPGIYPAGTPGFRYWAAAEALRRGGDFWAPILGVKQWEPGSVLQVGLDEGVDFNAYYDRTELAFFHDTADGQIVYSGESPDIVCHEMGHACLDAHRPQLWDTPFIEAGAFHESFGDMSAILSALQLPSVRTAALNGVAQDKASFLSRLAEQLGWAIRQQYPDAADPDCLRNAWNSFTYVDPETLPDSAPANKLCAEVHSFSRIFTGAFYEILSGMLAIRSKSPTEDDLAAGRPSTGRCRCWMRRLCAGATKLFRPGCLAHYRCRYGPLQRQVPGHVDQHVRSAEDHSRVVRAATARIQGSFFEASIGIRRAQYASQPGRSACTKYLCRPKTSACRRAISSCRFRSSKSRL